MPGLLQQVRLAYRTAASKNLMCAGGMLVVMKYNHVPYGASIWPAFWLMNSDNVWYLDLKLIVFCHF